MQPFCCKCTLTFSLPQPDDTQSSSRDNDDLEPVAITSTFTRHARGKGRGVSRRRDVNRGGRMGCGTGRSGTAAPNIFNFFNQWQ